ncbi:hypothetical protein RBB75_13595 [Tunturibacter empetritectus]|uniref:Extracellular repeat, HAF family n=1 Tax=Tunturiibacter empetritectus TaxID=3069691 RepID=A0AAU7Z9F5_9BACT
MPVISSTQSSSIHSSLFATGPIRLSFILVTFSLFAFTRAEHTQAHADQPPNTANPAVVETYKLEDLGELSPISQDVTVSLNQDGTVAYWTRTNGSVYAMLWRSGKATRVEQMPGYPNMIPHAINRQGDIAGWMNTSGNLVDSLSTTRGFVRHRKRIRIVTGLGGRDSRIFGLNDKGSAVGAATLADGTRHAFVISGSKIADLGTLPFGKSSTAYAINNSGLIAGSSDVDAKANHAVSWSNLKIVDLGTLPKGIVSSARSVNDRGQIVGFSDTPDGVHAFLYSDGVMQDLGTLGSDPSEASGINNHSEVVGASNITGTRRHAFLWRDGQIKDLNVFLPGGSSWILLDAFSINDRGQIACSARRKGEPSHLLLLTPQH